MITLSWRKALAVPTVAALALGGALLMSAPANAADPFAVTTPATGAVDVAQSLPNVVQFAGTGLPTADYASVSYLDATGGVHNATFGGSNNDGAGNWTGGENFDQLSVGQTQVVATVSAIDENTNVADAAITPVTTTFTLAVAPNPANPFVVTQPQSNSGTPVESTTPTFAGTGEPGDTITITYGARAGATGTAASTTVDATGNWTTTTDFSQLEPGATDGSAIVTETTPAGDVQPGTGGLRINFTFPTAPAPLADPTVTVTPDATALDLASTDGVAVTGTGFSPDEQVVITVADASGKAVTLAATPETFADATDGSFTGTLVLPANLIGGTYTVTLTGARSGVTANTTLYALATPTITAPTNGQKLTGDTVTFSGTGTPGADIGVIALPTAEYKAQIAQAQSSAMAQMQGKSSAKAATPAASPTDRIIVGADGTWTVTLAAKPGDYTVVALSALLDADGNAVINNQGDPVVSGLSNPVEFILAATVTGAGTPPTSLAYTGSNAGPFIGAAGLLLVVGAGLMVVSRRRKALEI